MNDSSTRYRRSRDYAARLCAITSGGAQTLSKMPARFPCGAYPIAVERADGPYVWDVDGHRYLDWICALGANAIGANHPHVLEACVRQLLRGCQFSLPTRLECEVSERFCAALGWPEMVRWVKTGSEACAAAVRVARRATGRTVILTSDQSYHGWSDIFTVLKPCHPGVPEFMAQGVGVFRYNDLGSLREALDAHAGQVAAVMMEPALLEEPAPGYLVAVRDLAHRHGALFVLDEMVLGGRLAYGGGSQHWRVQPDLACYGKALGGGQAIACVVGPRNLLRFADVISGTFSGDALGLAAVNATLDVYEAEPIIATQWGGGEALRQTVAPFAPAVRCAGLRVHPVLVVSGEHGALWRDVIVQEMAARGVLFHPAGFNISGVFSDEDIAETCAALTEVLRQVEPSEAPGARLKGTPSQPAFAVRKAL